MAWPGLSIADLYSALIANINARLQDAAKLFNGVTITDPFVDQTRFNPTTKRMERYDGAAWVDLNLDTPTVGGQAATSFSPATHNHDTSYEPKNTNIQTHIAAASPHSGHSVVGHVHDDRYYTAATSDARFAAAAAIFLTRTREFIISTPGVADGRCIGATAVETVRYRAGNYGISYVDSYDNYLNYNNYSNFVQA